MNTRSIKKRIFSSFPRKDIFLFKEASLGFFRQTVDVLDAIEELGERIGQAILQSFRNGIPVKGLYLYGHAGRAKELLLESIIRSFDNAKDIAFNWQERQRIQKFNCWPAVRLLQNGMFEKIVKTRHPLKTEEILIVRWSGNSREENLEQDRIEIELLLAKNEEEASSQKTASFEPRSDEFHTFANLAGTGNGQAIVESLKS